MSDKSLRWDYKEYKVQPIHAEVSIPDVNTHSDGNKAGFRMQS